MKPINATYECSTKAGAIVRVVADIRTPVFKIIKRAAKEHHCEIEDVVAEHREHDPDTSEPEEKENA